MATVRFDSTVSNQWKLNIIFNVPVGVDNPKTVWIELWIQADLASVTLSWLFDDGEAFTAVW